MPRNQKQNRETEAVNYPWADAYPELQSAADDWRYAPEPDCLSGRTILVTGAGAGIGAATAKSYAVFGANVVLVGRTRQKLEAVFDWIAANTSTAPVIVPLDLATIDESSVEDLESSIESTYARLDGIVHNASMLGPKTPLALYPVAEWQRVFQTNVHAAFLLTRGLFTLLDKSDNACVINVSSTVGREGRAYWGAYSASKFALEGFSQVLADETENAGRIRVYSVNPGGTRTAMRREAYPFEDPMTVAPAEAHMDLFLYLAEGRADKSLPATGAQLDARDWRPERD